VSVENDARFVFGNKRVIEDPHPDSCVKEAFDEHTHTHTHTYTHRQQALSTNLFTAPQGCALVLVSVIIFL